MKRIDSITDFEGYEIDSLPMPACLNKRPVNTHKGYYGHALLIAGSYGRCGCATLAARACMRMGAGLLTVHVPAFCVDMVQIGIPEAMVSIDEDNEVFSTLPDDLEKYNAIAVGPGIGTDKKSTKAFKELLEKLEEIGEEGKAQPPQLILDADAINILAKNPKWMKMLHANTILTPHAGEYERLFGTFPTAEARLFEQRKRAMESQLVLLYKGHHTQICTPDGKVYFNTTGNPGMATAGSGDVLTGVILGLSAQGLNAPAAAVAGVYIHGKSGDLALKNQSQASIIASDIVENLRIASME